MDLKVSKSSKEIFDFIERENGKWRIIPEHDSKFQKKLIAGDKPVYRIQALKDFGDVKAGDLGGFVSDTNCLSAIGDCWIYDNSIVLDARIEGDVKIKGDSIISNGAKIINDVELNQCNIQGNITIAGSVVICKGAWYYYDQDRIQLHMDGVIDELYDMTFNATSYTQLDNR